LPRSFAKPFSFLDNARALLRAALINVSLPSLSIALNPDIVNITRYSARPGTKAKALKGRIKTDVAKERSKILAELCGNISKENNRTLIGRKYNVLIAEKGKRNTFVGITENYKHVVIKENVNIGEKKRVEITDATVTHLVGNLI
jgi:tRNA A37 methylthiotransferase MiaB